MRPSSDWQHTRPDPDGLRTKRLLPAVPWYTFPALLGRTGGCRLPRP